MRRVLPYRCRPACVVGGEVTGVLDLNGLEHSVVGAQDVVTTGAVDSSFAVLPPSVEQAVGFALLEVSEEVFEAICGQ